MKKLEILEYVHFVVLRRAVDMIAVMIALLLIPVVGFLALVAIIVLDGRHE